MHGTTRFAPINRARRRWSPGLAILLFTLLAYAASVLLP